MSQCVSPLVWHQKRYSAIAEIAEQGEREESPNGEQMRVRRACASDARRKTSVGE